MDIDRNNPGCIHRVTFWAVAVFWLAVAMAAYGADIAPGGEPTFSSPEEALKAFTSAAATHDRAQVRALFGPETSKLESGDKVEDQNDFERFAKRLAERAVLQKEGDSRAIILVGMDDWPFPVPIVEQSGRWHFDTAAGIQEIVDRRVGQNELDTIDLCRAYVKAQQEYASKDRTGNSVLKYAQKLRSTPGMKDGLYWPEKAGEDLSPMGPLIAEARMRGYLPTRTADAGPRPYRGYLFRILERQGKHAPGGKYRYVINGNMIGGFALVAYPAIWGQSGVMTFIVNQQGIVYQKNLGPKTRKIAEKMCAYNPDDKWTAVDQR